jgi:hypothetical protein
VTRPAKASPNGLLPDGDWLATGGADGMVRLWPWRALLAAP